MGCCLLLAFCSCFTLFAGLVLCLARFLILVCMDFFPLSPFFHVFSEVGGGKSWLQGSQAGPGTPILLLLLLLSVFLRGMRGAGCLILLREASQPREGKLEG